MTSNVPWPEGRRFAFTVFDDPDASSEASRVVYHFLAGLGFRTTMGVWPLGPLRERNCPGETCADPAYRQHAAGMQSLGFEIGYHNAAPHYCTREEIVRAFELFREYFGAYPQSAANHFNADALYWGSARLHPGWCRALYDLATRGRQRHRFLGHVEGSPYFWGDLCREHIRYFRNFVFREIDTLKACPYQPYADPQRPFVRGWFCSAEGTDRRAFVETISEAHQDRLEEQGGMCIMYTHFGKGFVENGRIEPEFGRLMRRLSRKPGWFAPVATVLDHLHSVRGTQTIPPRALARMESRWLRSKLLHGTT
jgi:hypothetical protein